MEDIIVVEGTHDVIKIHEAYPNANCVITNGSEISIETINYI
ncbi:MAG: toprim domain-containing protein [Acholeplasmatales bacterium]|nr:toprim domain-containing protein [Acholeplasmatales bacterium]